MEENKELPDDGLIAMARLLASEGSYDLGAEIMVAEGVDLNDQGATMLSRRLDENLTAEHRSIVLDALVNYLGRDVELDVAPQTYLGPLDIDTC